MSLLCTCESYYLMNANKAQQHEWEGKAHAKCRVYVAFRACCGDDVGFYMGFK